MLILSMKLLRQGAEAELYVSKFEGKPALLKKRVEKGYRNKELDAEIGTLRTVLEARLIGKARSIGVRTPQVYCVDKAAREIVMEFVPGKRAKDVLNKKNSGKICTEIGEDIARLHSFNLVHGDLTTSNILIHNNSLVFIDFGLAGTSRKVEDKAVDLLVFKKTFEATHAELMPVGWEKIVKGYLKETGSEGKTVVAHIAKVEKRARYH